MRCKRILIVDDEEQIRFSISFALKMKGYGIVETESGEKALEAIINARQTGFEFDIVVMDICMPGLSGEELILKINQIAADLPILVITGFGSKALLISLIRLGCKDFIEKPFEPRDIEERIELILNKSHLEALEKKRNEYMALLVEKTGSMVHDMKNMMQSALGYAELILRNLEAEHPVRGKVERLMNSTILAADICRKLLALKPQNPGKVKSKTDVRFVVEHMSEVIKAVAPDSVVIATKVPKQPIWLAIDSENLKQALLNLGINACDAIEGKGTLTFSLEILKSAGSNGAVSESIIRITVADTGKGIPEADLGRIFNKGFTTKINGHGYGLDIVNDIVQKSGGRIEVKSEVNRGTRFELFFPYPVSGKHKKEDRKQRFKTEQKFIPTI